MILPEEAGTHYSLSEALQASLAYDLAQLEGAGAAESEAGSGHALMGYALHDEEEGAQGEEEEGAAEASDKGEEDSDSNKVWVQPASPGEVAAAPGGGNEQGRGGPEGAGRAESQGRREQEGAQGAGGSRQLLQDGQLPPPPSPSPIPGVSS